MAERRRPRNPDGRNLAKIMLPVAPLASRIELRARDVGREGVGEWLRCHPRGGPSEARVWQRAKNSGTVSARVADRWAIRLLGMTLDEIYGPDWDDPAQTAAA